jgi:hypothetical protein
MWTLEARDKPTSATIREVANEASRHRCAWFHRPPAHAHGLARFLGDPNVSPIRNLANERARQNRAREHPAPHLAGVR